MPRRWFRSVLPDHSKFREHRWLQRFGKLLHDDDIWHLNRRSVAGGMSLGIFLGLLPIPMQMPLAALLAIKLRVNLPLAVIAVWISNPLTLSPMIYFNYKFGAWLLDMPAFKLEFEMTLKWLAVQGASILQPLIVGSLAIATIGGAITYGLVRLLWRMEVVRKWRLRRELKRERSARHR